MTQAMSELRRRHPRIELHFAEGEPEDSVPAVKRGGYDLALAFDFVAFPEDFGRDTDSELIFTDPMRVALPPGHPPGADGDGGPLGPGRRGVALRRGAELLPRSRDQRLPGGGLRARISFESDDYQVIQGPGRRGAGGGPDSRARPARPRGRPARHRARPADPPRLCRHP
ncbi:MAG: LysR substrate-binding domain-containing protein, partial [Solirubrobacterales bacterium]